ncbi:MAG: hypothetical protein ACTH2O_03140 [Cellulosimicrobium funkei]
MSPAPTYTVNCSILLTDLPLLERPAAAAAARLRGGQVGGPGGAPTPAPAPINKYR